MIMIVDMGIEKTYYIWQASNKKKHDVCIIMTMTTSKRKKTMLQASIFTNAN